MLLFYGKITVAQVAYDRLEIKTVGEKSSIVPEEKIKKDINDEFVGYILVKSPVSDLSFEGDIVGDVLKENQDNIYFYYVPMVKDSKILTINHNIYHQVKFNFPFKLKGNELWEVEIIGIEGTDKKLVDIDHIENTQLITIDKEYFTDLYIDEILQKETTTSLEEGSHYIKVKYKSQEYEQRINVDSNNTNFNIKLGGEIIVKNAGDSIKFIYNKTEATQPLLEKHKGNTYIYDGMLGTYTFIGKPSGLTIGEISHKFNVSKRSSKTFYLDEMINYGFISYHGTHIQPVGVSIGFYRKFGFLISYSTHLKSKVKTPYGETDFTYTNDEGEQKKRSRSVSQTLSGGPMFRLWRNLFLHIGAGWAYYLQTSEPGVLTYDYKYKSGLSVNGGLMIQFQNFIIGAGFTHQFVENAFDKNLSNQIAFSAGFTLPYSAKHAK